MNTLIKSDIRKTIAQYCAALGKDPMLVQGAGGNASWKDANTLWVKASGAWLADAVSKNIFVSVDLAHLQHSLSAGDYSVIPRLSTQSHLKPSIETLLHALMPHPIVIHLHAIDILARLVRKNCEPDLKLLLENSGIVWTIVDYHKPGAALAKAIKESLDKKSNINVIFLKNHGVVVGGNSIIDIDMSIRKLTKKLKVLPCASSVRKNPPTLPFNINDQIEYLPALDSIVHYLATDSALFNKLETDWALYPDHVVFLGAKAKRYNHIAELQSALSHEDATAPELVFIRDLGVFTQKTFDASKQAQLRCYYDIISRQSINHALNTLTHQQISALINWDAEQYRIGIAK